MKKPFLWFFTILPFFLTTCQTSTDTHQKILHWDFPINRTHAGILLGNGTQGLMVWGQNSVLNITVGRAGFWDHRGGNDFTANTNFQEVKKMLQSGNDAGLKKTFGIGEKRAEIRPHQVGGGIVQLTFPNWEIQNGQLDLKKGLIQINLYNPSTEDTESIQIEQAIFHELAWLELSKELRDIVKTEVITSWDLYLYKLKGSVNEISSPDRWSPDFNGSTSTGFVQHLPDSTDPSLAICVNPIEERIVIASFLGKNGEEEIQKTVQNPPIEKMEEENERWWKSYWKDVPTISLPDPVLQEIVDYGLYKQACATPEHGLACTLQGPFLEAYQFPPWSADYHLNINLEMIYTPALATNRAGHLNPMWKMLKEWMPKMKETGEAFFERKGALMMPHAVDDKCQVVGNFWTGTIDHACAAWMAQLAWQHYRYTMDTTVLRDVAFPMMQGAFEGYWAMLDSTEKEDGTKKMFLPITVSPEYRGARMDAWGADASFQLAALRMTAENLQKAAPLLKNPPDQRWQNVLDQVPHYSTHNNRIALWEGMDLLESHRHHSHLASIYPFVTLDPFDEKHEQLVKNSIRHWIKTGAGQWSGWCVPWAATLQSRLNNAESAVAWLHHWKQNFVNEGRGTLHDAAFKGMSVIASDWSDLKGIKVNREKMQLDAGFGALSAVLEILVQHRRDGVYVLPDIPIAWKELSFDNIRTEGAFQIGASVKDGKVVEVRVKSNAEEEIRLYHQLGERWTLDGKEQSTPYVQLKCSKGDRFVLRRKTNE